MAILERFNVLKPEHKKERKKQNNKMTSNF